VTSIASITILKLALASLVSAAVVVEDLRYRRISNRMCAALMISGAVPAAVCWGWKGLGDALLGAVLGFAVFLVPYGLGGMGGGDVKLMAAFGVLTGLQGILPAIVLVSIAGAVTAVISLIWNHLRQQTEPVAIPYAPAIAAGSLLVAFGQIGAR
jgi:prepilin peptidase CpaA